MRIVYALACVAVLGGLGGAARATSTADEPAPTRPAPDADDDAAAAVTPPTPATAPAPSSPASAVATGTIASPVAMLAAERDAAQRRAAGDATRALVEAGTHRRLATPFGPVHVWTPRGYDPATAHVVVYVHGYYIGADRAWREHRLAAQFAASRRNAMFIACDGPEDSAEGVSWRSLPRLLDVTARGLGRALPSGPVVAIAHGGGARTLLGWLASDRLRAVALLDAPFVAIRPFVRWSARADHRLVAVHAGPHATPPGAAATDLVLDGLSALATRSRALGRRTFVRAARSHRALAAEGDAIPAVLGALVPALPRSARPSAARPAAAPRRGR